MIPTIGANEGRPHRGQGEGSTGRAATGDDASQAGGCKDLRSQGKKLEEIAGTLNVSMSSLARALGPRATKRPVPTS